MTSISLKPVSAPLVAADRVAWVDNARGIGIALVVLGHAIGGLRSAGLVDNDGAYALAFDLIYSFHMPLFFLLSGLFVSRFARPGLAAHLGSTARRIVYPYLLWSAISLAAVVGMGGLVNHPVEGGLATFVSILWAPPAQLWFLYGLAVLQVLYIILLPVAGLVPLFGLLLLARLLPMALAAPDFMTLTATYAPFFGAGALISSFLRTRLGTLPRPWLLQAGCAAAALWLMAALAALAAGYGYTSAAMIPASIAGTAAVLLLAPPPTGRPAVVLGYLGRRSMPIFLMHVLFVAGTRIVLAKGFGLTDPALLLPLLFVAGLVGSLAAFEAARRLGFERLAGFS